MIVYTEKNGDILVINVGDGTSTIQAQVLTGKGPPIGEINIVGVDIPAPIGAATSPEANRVTPAIRLCYLNADSLHILARVATWLADALEETIACDDNPCDPAVCEAYQPDPAFSPE